MNSLEWWQNLIGEILASFAVMAVVLVLSELRDQPVPTWGWYLAAMIGIILWSRPSYKRKQDFDK